MENNLSLNNLTNTNVDLRLNSAVHLSLIEIVLGSLLHSLKFPFTGHMLSLNQAIYLSRLSYAEETRIEATKACLEVSALVAFFKTLSPGGKRLGPMISLFMQGLLFTIGVIIFGRNKLGHGIGLVLLSLWAFFQPILSYLIIFGIDFIPALDYAQTKINKFGIDPKFIIFFILTVYFFKCITGIILLFTTQKWAEEKWGQLDAKIKKLGKHLPLKDKKCTNHFQSYVKELLNPFFILTMVFFVLLLTFQGLSMDEVMIRCLRPMAILTLLFFLRRSSLVKKILSWLESRSKRFEHFMQRVRSGLASLMHEKSMANQEYNDLINTIHSKDYKKILILGNPGSGKSTLAKKLFQDLGFHHIETDNLRWEENQKGKSEKDNFKVSLNKQLKSQSWIIEGNYNLIKNLLPPVDLVIELNLPKWIVLFRLLKRDLGNFMKKPFSQTSDLFWVLRKGLKQSYDKGNLKFKSSINF
ncbi:AAA family ATPase [Bacteriovoracaceae bacterium]|nr:AAA family ATPase [Bacteriovoracaceae bacterium]